MTPPMRVILNTVFFLCVFNLWVCVELWTHSVGGMRGRPHFQLKNCNRDHVCDLRIDFPLDSRAASLIRLHT